MHKYERHLSAMAMMAGFVVDTIVFKRVDLPTTQIVFLTYTIVCVVSITALHAIEARAEAGHARPRWRAILPITTQFALGGFWSGFLIFYTRGSVIATAWPFLLILILVFFGNELFKRYLDRLVFTSILFFFALYSYSILMVPVYTGTIGTFTFLASSVIAVVLFALFMKLLRLVGRVRFEESVRRIRIGVGTVLSIIMLLFFTDILPPLPLSLASGGVYHSVYRSGDNYNAQREAVTLRERLTGSPTIHIGNGNSLGAFSAVFAPIKLETTIVHTWQRYDVVLKEWITESVVSFPITGGRNNGYRGYSTKANPENGKWRVNVETKTGHLIGRLRFTVDSAKTEPTLHTVVLD